MVRSFLLAVILVIAAAPAQAQIPDTFTNLQVLPEDIGRGQLIQTMRDFSMGTGLRCESCHYDAGGEGSFRDIDFASDANPRKDKARFMMRMLREMNQTILPAMAGRIDPPVTMTCKTCHRGQATPMLLSQDLFRTVEASGVDSAITRYRWLREQYGMSGAYDFGEFETNGVAEQLAGEGRADDALAILEMNAEYHPGSATIQASLGQLYQVRQDTVAAIAAYERALELGAPERQIMPRLQALRSH